ncbi:MAG: sulfatase [Actinomycetota bacterium]|nr:sulfatase [Actinomycetota bacterium]
MKRIVLLLASVASAVLFVLAAGVTTAPTAAQVSPSKPNFVFILADDMRKDDLKYMPKTRHTLMDEGMYFKKAFVSTAMCCPSRATILRGQYTHNHGVWKNVSGPDGGWKAYRQNGNEQFNLATRLDKAGYRTALLGKYFNGYKDTRFTPPGWDKWFATFTFDYFDYNVNDNGTIRHFGTAESDYVTDVLRVETKQFIDTSVRQGDPFFAYVAPIAPHIPWTPAPRDKHTFDGAQAPRPPSFNEEDVGDKPPWIQSLQVLGPGAIDRLNSRYERRAETLQALDDLVAGVVGKLKSSGALQNTYIVFTSDHGIHRGEHRIPASKGRPYEEDIRVPLLVRGPNVAAGSTTDKLTLNTDFFPTFTNLAGLQRPDYVDGRSLRPVLEGSATTWRSAFLLEGRKNREAGETPDFYGVRTSSGEKYIEYEGGARELYSLSTDPFELVNSYDVAARPEELKTRLEALKGCDGAECRAAENGP